MPRHKEKKLRHKCRLCERDTKNIAHHLIDNHLYGADKIVKYMQEGEEYERISKGTDRTDQEV